MDRPEKWLAVKEKDLTNFSWKTVIRLNLSASTHSHYWKQRRKGKLEEAVQRLSHLYQKIVHVSAVDERSTKPHCMRVASGKMHIMPQTCEKLKPKERRQNNDLSKMSFSETSPDLGMHPSLRN